MGKGGCSQQTVGSKCSTTNPEFRGHPIDTCDVGTAEELGTYQKSLSTQVSQPTAGVAFNDDAATRDDHAHSFVKVDVEALDMNGPAGDVRGTPIVDPKSEDSFAISKDSNNDSFRELGDKNPGVDTNISVSMPMFDASPSKSEQSTPTQESQLHSSFQIKAHWRGSDKKFAEGLSKSAMGSTFSNAGAPP